MKWQYLAALLIAYETACVANYSAPQKPVRKCVMAATNNRGAIDARAKERRTKKPDQGRAF